MTLLFLAATWGAGTVGFLAGWAMRHNQLRGTELGSAVEVLAESVELTPTIYRDMLLTHDLIGTQAYRDLNHRWSIEPPMRGVGNNLGDWDD